MNVWKCFYCNEKGKKTCVNNESKKERYYIYINGIDRIDNTKGYLKDNVVPSCFICNVAKRNLSLDDFQEWAQRLCQNLGTW